MVICKHYSWFLSMDDRINEKEPSLPSGKMLVS